jgi:hypothetical protein
MLIRFKGKCNSYSYFKDLVTQTILEKKISNTASAFEYILGEVDKDLKKCIHELGTELGIPIIELHSIDDMKGSFNPDTILVL